MKHIQLRMLAAVAACALPCAGHAQFTRTATATFPVTLTITSNCVISAAPLAFGSTSLLTTNLDLQSTVNITCTNSTPYAVGLDEGTGTGSTGTTRFMAGTTSGNTSTVSYQLYRDANYTDVWGVTVGTNTVSGTGNGSAQPIPVYGRVPPQAAPTPDSYTSTVTATVNF
ncbi:Sigma-fimbriae tip adhesin [plant metagenome]|uniref:Sigma-fimbriae tip adhesin n=1 Tax=plant metagenome TaxID=1297885 RepID=A0A484UIA7_9ZZZZ